MAASLFGYSWTKRGLTKRAGNCPKILNRTVFATSVFLLSPLVSDWAAAQTLTAPTALPALDGGTATGAAPGAATGAATGASVTLTTPPVAGTSPVMAPVAAPVASSAVSKSPASAATAAAAYQVTDVPVDASGVNAVKAREAAIAQGQQKALQMLLQRMTGASDPSSLPQVSAAEAERMVLAVSPKEEKTSAVRYLAKLDVTFMPSAVQALLQKANIPAAAEPAKPLVVLPVWRPAAGAQALLWEDPNPWRAAWMGKTRSGTVPLVVPIGDLADLTAVDVEKARSLSEDALHAIAARYKAEDALVAEAVAVSTSGGPMLQVTLRRAASLHMEPLTFTVRGAAGEDLVPVLTKAVEQTSSQLDGGWKKEALAYAGPPTHLEVHVQADSLEQWLASRAALDQVPAVRGWKLLSLSRQGAEISLDYGGSFEMFNEALSKQGLSLQQDNDRWILRKTGA